MIKVKRISLIGSSIIAGAAIAFGGILFLLAKMYLRNGALVGSLLFPIGLLTICFGKFHLYTGKVGLIDNIDTEQVNKFLWLMIILIGNIVGAALVGLVIYQIPLFKNIVTNICISKSINNPNKMFIDSMLCGILVYLAVYFFNNSKTNFGKIFGILIPIAFFVYCGFQHCIANVFYLAAGNSWNFNSIFNLLICILGNSVSAGILNIFAQKSIINK